MRAAVTFGWLFFALAAHPAWAQQDLQACRVACRVELSPPSPATNQCLSHCMSGRPLAREAPGQARPAGPRPAEPVAILPPGAAAAPPPVTFGAVYLATPPNMGFGMVVGQPDRLTAHRQAEFACRASGASCLMARDFDLPCAAIAEGVIRAPGAFVMTSDPTTFRVRAITYAIASNPADAQSEARETCARRERGTLTCRIVQSHCGPR